MLSMHCRILLCHCWSYSSHWNMYCRNIFCGGRRLMFFLYCWYIFSSWCFGLSSLYGRKIFGSRSINMYLVRDWNLFISERL